MSLTSARPYPGRLWGRNEAFIATVLYFVIWSAISVLVAASTIAAKLVNSKRAKARCRSTYNPFTNWRVLCSSMSIRRSREPSLEPRALIPPVIPCTPLLGNEPSRTYQAALCYPSRWGLLTQPSSKQPLPQSMIWSQTQYRLEANPPTVLRPLSTGLDQE
ncbi:hypothetical protein M9H77_31119 [Catharanthus roseus]|uniref:Uncharacterized protein n=1 Tax=Catharanthus roseus TaxID=4058 RepID=A0ACC0A0G4_CATRO|nr:hypothetical protein M9H77_31119 [Catharanthus roseus]